MCTQRSKIVSSCLSVALFLTTLPSFAAGASSAAPARLTGTVYTDDVKTPLAGATVVATDARGVALASEPTRADGTFTIASLSPGRTALALETKEGTFAVATPLTLAPGEARGVRLALKGGRAAGAKGAGTSGGAPMSGGAIAAMTVVILGFVTAAAVGINDHNNDESAPSPSLPSE